MLTQQQETTAVQRRQRMEIIRCSVCNELVCQDSFCSACGTVFDMQGLVDFLVGLGCRKPNPPLAA